MKHFSFCFLSFLAFMSLSQANFARCNDKIKIDGIYYVINGYEAHVTGYDSYSHVSSITIPSSIYYQNISRSVTVIDDHAFEGSNITKIYLPPSIVEIGDAAFNGCENLLSLEIPDNVMTIGEFAFSNCKLLRTISLPNKITSLEGSTFSHCTGIETIILPEALTQIKEHSFYNCLNLSNINIPNSVTAIDEYAFAKCSKIFNIILPNSLKRIGEYAFYGCSGLLSIHIPESVKNIGEGAFDGCVSVENVEVDNDAAVPIITGCTNLKCVTISNTVDNRFYKNCLANCTKLNTININIVNWEKNTEFMTNTGGCALGKGELLSKFLESVHYYYNGHRIKGKFCIPDNISDLGNNILFGCSEIETLQIPSSVNKIGRDSFRKCSSLKRIIIHDNPSCVVSRDIFKDSNNIHEIFIINDFKNKISDKWQNVEYIINNQDKVWHNGNMVTFKNITYSYVGKKKNLEFTNNLKDYEVSVNLIDEVQTNVGSYTATAHVKYSNELDIEFNTDYAYTITKADLSIAIDNKSKTYGDPNPELTYKINGFVNGENESSLSDIRIYCNASMTSNVGEYTIQFEGSAQNYNVPYAKGILTISKFCD